MIKDLIYIQHILEQIEVIENSTNGISRERFDNDINLKDATIRRIEIIGEAIKNISEGLKKDYSKVEWKKIAGTRDVVIHSYFKIEWNLVWEVIQNDIKSLKEQIINIKEDIEKGKYRK